MTAGTTLERGLGLPAAASVVVGCMIGTGVFLKAAIMAQETGSASLLLAIWVIAGLLSLAGALSYSELGGMFPRAGGEYVYLREAYGDLPAFLFGWMRFWIASPGSIAAYGVGASIFLKSAAPGLPGAGSSAVAVVFIAIFSALNCLSIRAGGKLQTVMTAVKILLIAGISIGALFFAGSGNWSHLASAPATDIGWSGLGAATLAALWAYDGWANVTMLAGEVDRPERNIPRALALGTGLVMALYVLIHLGYLHALPFVEIATSSSRTHPDAIPVAAKAIQTFLGGPAHRILSAIFVFSALGAMNGSIAACARVPYAMASDGLFPRWLAGLSARTRVPVRSILVQGIFAAALALAGTFDELTDYVVFASWIFYALVTSALFVLRRRRPELPRPYRVVGYPFLPAVFIALSVALLTDTLLTGFRSAVTGLFFIALGVPAYLAFRRTAHKPA